MDQGQREQQGPAGGRGINIAKGKWQPLREDGLMKLWSQAADERGGTKARTELIARQDLNREQRIALLSYQANTFRHKLGDKPRPQSIPLYAEWAKLDPANYEAARAWVEAARYYGEPPARLEAANFFIGNPAKRVDTSTVRNLLAIAKETENPDLARKVHAWAKAAEDKFGIVPDYATEIGTTLIGMELEAEGKAWLQRHLGVDPNHYEHRSCASQLLKGMPPESQIPFIEKLLAVESDNHGHYAGWLADRALRAGDPDRAAAVLNQARQRQDGRAFRSFGIDDLVGGWIDFMNPEENPMPAARQAAVLTALRDLRAGRSSAVAGLELASMEGGSPAVGLDRLLDVRESTLMVSRDAHSWNNLWPYAQAFHARKKHAEAATLATALLKNVGSVGENEASAARRIVSQSYGRMGSLGMEVDPDSPLAPLLEIGLHLRLGDADRAQETYIDNQALFDAHRLEVPTEILLFAADFHVMAGGSENERRAEDILRSWLIKFGQAEQVPGADKAKVQLLLAKNYERMGRYEVARNEYTTVFNNFPETVQATEARFGIGQTFMEQKIFDQAGPIFEELATSPLPKVRLRAEFLRGVLAGRMGDQDAARDIFRNVLGSMPDTDLADQALFGLAEVYGNQQRYLDQLELLRTVGRLGRDSARWLEPGRALSIVVQDPDLGISRGNSKIPVIVKTEPGGDSERAYLKTGGAGRGIFIGEVPTALGAAAVDDGILQVLGDDEITVSYPDEFRGEFRGVDGGGGSIRLASDGAFAMASSEIPEETEEENAAEELATPVDEELEALLRAEARPDNQIKPGNLLYLRVEDHDRSRTADADEVIVKIEASSGDAVEARLMETGGDTGIFAGNIRTADLPAAAAASDTAINHSPLMAMDSSPETAWVSEPDGIGPKWLTVDLKDLAEVSKLKVTSPGGESEWAKRLEVHASHDGRFFYRVARFPAAESAPAAPAGGFARMRQRVYKVGSPNFENWGKILELAEKGKPVSDGPAESMAWNAEPAPVVEGQEYKGPSGPHAVLWQGKFVQASEGAVRFGIEGLWAAVMVDGELVQSPQATEAGPVDVFLPAGVHDLVIFASTADAKKAGVIASRARENLNREQVVLAPFLASDFDLGAAGDLPAVEARASATVSGAEGTWTFEIPPTQARYLRVTATELGGQSLAFNHIEVDAGTERIIPTEADLLALTFNDILEIAPGDEVTATFIDTVTGGGLQRNRALTQRVTATYHNATIKPVALDFLRGGNGSVVELRKELLRIDPGERVSFEVTDYDLDRTAEPDTLEVEVRHGAAEPILITALETGSSTGVFRGEFDTTSKDGTAAPAPAPEPAGEESAEEGAAAEEEDAAPVNPNTPKLTVAPGDTIFLRYRDPENTFPGHPAYRESPVYVRTPTPGKMRIVPTRWSPPPADAPEGARPTLSFLENNPGEGVETPVAFQAPLTVEVIDPDAAKDSHSSVVVELMTPTGEPVRIACQVSSAHAPAGSLPENVENPALHAGRFVGQIRMQLGGPRSPGYAPADIGESLNYLGTVLPPEEKEEEPADPPNEDPAGAGDSPEEMEEDEAKEEEEEDEEDAPAPMSGPQSAHSIPVFNLTGNDKITATYTEELTPDPAAGNHLAVARLASQGQMALTDPEYSEPITEIHIGQRLHLRLDDPDLDLGPARDKVSVTVTTGRGEREEVLLEETLAHSGVFTAALDMKPTAQATPGNLETQPTIEAFFQDTLSAGYLDNLPGVPEEGNKRIAELRIAPGTDGLAAAFSKLFQNEELAIETQFHIAESYFELFKSHNELGREEEAEANLRRGRRVLSELQEDYPDPKYAPRISYLLGQFSQELKDWPQAIEAYGSIVREYGDHSLAPDAQYKLGQCYEEAERFDEALEAYVTLAATYPENPLIASVMIRISEHFYQREEYVNAASVGREVPRPVRLPPLRPNRLAFRVGQCYYKAEEFPRAGDSFDAFVKKFPDDELTPQALFWSGESPPHGQQRPRRLPPLQPLPLGLPRIRRRQILPRPPRPPRNDRPVRTRSHLRGRGELKKNPRVQTKVDHKEGGTGVPPVVCTKAGLRSPTLPTPPHKKKCCEGLSTHRYFSDCKQVSGDL